MNGSKSLSTLKAFAILLSSSFPSDPALASDCPTPSFAAARTFAAGAGPVFVAVSDFNGDGKPDLALVNSIPDTVSVLLGQGDGDLGAAVSYAAASRAVPDPVAVVVADFDGDGKPDLAVANRAISRVSVLLGNGDGTFRAAVDYGAASVSDAGPVSLAVGDFDGDAKLDLAVLNHSASKLSVLLGKGDGTFRTAVDNDSGAVGARGPISMAAGDFNGDGKPDLAAVNHHTDKLSVLLGKGDATFQAAVDYQAGAAVLSGPVAVAVGDFNGDGKPDLAVANEGIGRISVLVGRGEGKFRAAVDYQAAAGAEADPVAVAVGDFNGDSKLDLAVVHHASDTVSVLLGTGVGTLQKPVDYAVGSGPQSVAVGDFDGDGQLDLAVANQVAGTASLLLNTCGSAEVGVAIAPGDSTVTVSWPFPSAGFVLESTPSLSSPAWQAAVVMLVTNSSRLEVAVPADLPERYFRLRKP